MSEGDTDTETRSVETETTMTEPVRSDTETVDRERAATVDDVEVLRSDVVAFAEEVEDRIVKRDDLEAELEAYVRKRQRSGHARDWGPYLVLLYGTVMTLGAFFYLDGATAIVAMIIVWLSTLGLYAIMALAGFVGTVVSAPGRLLDRLAEFRS